MSEDHYLFSREGILNFPKNQSSADNQKNLLWTTDYNIDLPIKISKSGPNSKLPITLIEQFQMTVKEKGDKPALSQKRDKKWHTLTFKQYYQESLNFAEACLRNNIIPGTSCNIIGFNSQEWFISFFGSLFAGLMPVGVYTTNNSEACEYVAENSDCSLVIVEDNIQLQKYLKALKTHPKIQLIVVYNDKQTQIYNEFPQKIMLWKDFVKPCQNSPSLILSQRMQIFPGKCCTVVYTSGTTGNPKGVMLSHDNYTWTTWNTFEMIKKMNPRIAIDDQKIVSYLPLSHCAAQLFDLTGPICVGIHVYIAGPDALQGSLIQTLQEIRPTLFLGVPRVWEKIYEKMQQVAKQNTGIKSKVSTWAKNQGLQESYNQMNKKETSTSFNIANKLIFNTVKKTLGLDQCTIFLFGAAPLSFEIRKYFLSLNIPLINAYGMSESSGPQCFSLPSNFDNFGDEWLKSCGSGLDGTQMEIYGGQQEGEICYRGRNIFMGYYKNEQATKETFDERGFLHSGDVGSIDKKGNLTITGRIKELIITAGGENVAPVLLENEVKKALGDIVSNCIIIGDQKKYLTVLLCLKQAVDEKGIPLQNLTEDGIQSLKARGVIFTTIENLKKDKTFKSVIDKGLDEANKKAISKAQYIRKWDIIDDFSVGNELTPTMKLKRNVVAKKYHDKIEKLYLDPAL